MAANGNGNGNGHGKSQGYGKLDVESVDATGLEKQSMLAPVVPLRGNAPAAPARGSPRPRVLLVVSVVLNVFCSGRPGRLSVLRFLI